MTTIKIRIVKKFQKTDGIIQKNSEIIDTAKSIKHWHGTDLVLAMLQNTVRRCFCSDRVDGSVHLIVGKSSCVATVSGPVEAPLAVELPDQAQISVVVHSPSGYSRTFDRVLEKYVHGVLEACLQVGYYPRKMIRCSVQLKSSDLFNISCIINAAVLACIDAGLSMITTPICVICASVNSTILSEEELLSYSYEV